MKQENLNKIEECINILKEVYDSEISDGANRYDFRLVTLLEIIKKVASWRKRCNLSSNSCFRLARW